MKPADAKLQRWIDVIAVLLRHRFGATFADLKNLVPAYGDADKPETVARMFERDKDELRTFGLPIRVRDEETEEGTTQRYYMKAREVYLPYLAIASGPGAPAPAVPPPGYRDVPKLNFEPDELSTLLRAAHEAESVGDPDLARDAASAIRKLTYDLGVALGSAAGESDSHAARIPRPEPRSIPAVSLLGEALFRRKSVSFVYRSMNRDVTEERVVEPYGLALTSSHWYLIGRDVGAAALRKFRVSRMTQVVANQKKPQSADYEIPKDFDLAEHAGANGPWELGDGPAEEMVVEIRGERGAAMSVRTLGAVVLAFPARRRFKVRRIDSFVRWVMSFSGDVVPVSPPRLCEQYRAVVAATLAKYEGTPT